MNTRTCPQCGEILNERQFGQIKLDGCASCGGIWFDRDELRGLAHDREVGMMAPEREFNPGVQGSGTGGAMNCPNCNVHLYSFSYPHTPDVNLDACPKCKGIWVDNDELKQMAESMAAVSSNRAIISEPTETERMQARVATGFLISAPCTNCEVTNPASAIVCCACGARITTRSAVALCPRCDMALQEFHMGHCDTRLDACVSCKGVWFASGELSVLIQIGMEEIQRLRQQIGDGLGHYMDREIAKARVIHCPRCHRGMTEEPLGSSDALLDHCDYCNGVWLDAGELINAFQMYSSGNVASKRLTVDLWSANTN